MPPKSRRARLAESLRSACVTIAAAVLTALVAMAVDPEPGIALFGVLLAISLSRSQLERDVRGRLEAGVALPLIALLGAAVGALLHAQPWVGALVFSLALACSVLLRKFGEVGRRLGALVAMPFTVLLIAPVHSTRLDPLWGPVATVGVGLAAWAAVTLLQLAAIRIGFLPRPTPGRVAPRAGAGPDPGPDPAAGPDAATGPIPPTAPGPASEPDPATAPDPATGPPAAIARGGMRPDATTRLAVQLFATIGTAFCVGYLVFPERWSWIVVTALIVSLAGAGRAQVLFTSLERVVGAGIGSLLALLPLVAPSLPAGAAVALILVVLFAGLVLRPLAYLWWALCVTCALALAQGTAIGRFSLWERWEEIVIGAAIALIVSAFLLPVRSEAVVRRRIGAVLAALAEQVAATTSEERPPGAVEAGAAPLRRALADLDRVARPFDAARRLPARWRPAPAGWIASTREAAALLTAAPRRAALRPLGAARRALRTPAELQARLDELVEAAR